MSRSEFWSIFGFSDKLGVVQRYKFQINKLLGNWEFWHQKLQISRKQAGIKIATLQLFLFWEIYTDAPKICLILQNSLFTSHFPFLIYLRQTHLQFVYSLLETLVEPREREKKMSVKQANINLCFLFLRFLSRHKFKAYKNLPLCTRIR